jgi:hypothetical protein
MKRLIRLFMWGYQPHFASALRRRAEQVFEELGVAIKPDVLLVGILKPDAEDHPVCIEPEDGKWDLSLFSDVPVRYPEIVRDHPLQNVFYGDEPSMRDKPENIRRSSAMAAVQESLKTFDKDHDVKSFCGAARPIGNYYVVPVLQISMSVFRQFPPLDLPNSEDEFHPSGEHSLVHSCLRVLLDEASRDLLGPEPGRSLTSDMRSASEIVAEGAENFMRIPDLLTSKEGYGSGDLFQRLNIISSLFYEGKEGVGSLVLVKPANPSVDYVVRFEVPVPLRQPRWARKILAMASPDIALIVNDGQIYGLGRLKPDHDPTDLDAFMINFLDHYQWELRYNAMPLMFSRYREPRLPQPPIDRERFQSNFLRLFPQSTNANADHLWRLFETGAGLGHGSMLVVAEDAALEAVRLSDQGTAIHAVQMTPELLERVSGIDGSILIDPTGVCHAVGVILDGEASKDCSPARGSRFNSALRYVSSRDKRRMALVFSDDRTVDIVPLLRPQIRRADVEKHIAELERASVDVYHSARNWLGEHRFYLDSTQCARINAALERLEPIVMADGQIWVVVSKFEPDPELDETYFLQ